MTGAACRVMAVMNGLGEPADIWCGIRGRRVVVAGRHDMMRQGLARRLTAAGGVVIETGDPAAALSAVAAAAAAVDPVVMLAVAAEGVPASDWSLFDRITVLFGSPRMALMVVGAGECPLPLARRLGAGASDAVLAATVAEVLLHPDQPAIAKHAESGILVATPAPEIGARPDDGRRRILLAEDNEVNQMVAIGMLTSLGIVAEVVGNGRDAVTAVVGGDFDAVLMDVRMPVMDGLEAARRIRALTGTKGQIPIIAVTANAMRGDQDACIAAGMNDYLAKPIRLATLEVALKRWLG